MPTHSQPATVAAPADGRPRAGTVCWSASVAGAAAAAALSLLTLTPLLLGPTPPELGAAAMAWLLATQLMAAGVGGYLAGRLRTRRVRRHHDEFFLYGPAHGLLSWAIAALLTVSLLAALSTGAGRGPVVTAAPDTGALLGQLFRADGAASATGQPLSATTHDEIRRIFTNTLQMGVLPSSDQRYLGQLLTRQTGLPRAQAEQRVAETYAMAREQQRRTEIANRQALDLTRQAFAYTALCSLVLLLGGALVAGLAAAYGAGTSSRQSPVQEQVQ